MIISQRYLFKIALYSNVLYVFMLFLFKPDGLNISNIIITGFLVFSFLSVLYLAFKNGYRLKEIPKTGRVLFYLLISYVFVVIARSFSTSLQDWLTNFGSVYMALAWLTPTLLIIGLRMEFWSAVYKAIKLMFGLMVLAFVIYFIGAAKAAEEWNWLFRPINFILLTVFYKFKILEKLKIFFILIIYLIIATVTEFRFEFLYLGMTLFFLMIDRIYGVKIRKSLLKYILGIFIVLLTLIFTVGYEQVSSIALMVVEFQDSRSFLFNELFYEFSKTNDLWFGRGSLGEYFSEFFRGARIYYEKMGRVGWPGDSPVRNTIEVGYLQMILKGGFVLFFLYTVLAFYAAYLALFRSKNKFVKRLGFYISIILILSIVSLRPAFTPTFIIFWMAIGSVLSPKYRYMDDNEINSLINGH